MTSARLAEQRLPAGSLGRQPLRSTPGFGEPRNRPHVAAARSPRKLVVEGGGRLAEPAEFGVEQVQVGIRPRCRREAGEPKRLHARTIKALAALEPHGFGPTVEAALHRASSQLAPGGSISRANRGVGRSGQLRSSSPAVRSRPARTAAAIADALGRALYWTLGRARWTLPS
jgi:hypothetical protein